MITDNILVQFIVIVLGLGTIGRLIFGGWGGFIGLFLGIILFWVYRSSRKKNIDYDRIEAMFQKYHGKK